MGPRSIALDSAGYPHISYLDGSELVLKYAWYDGTFWISEVVDGADETGGYTSLVLDSAGRLHISYYDWSNRDLKYAYFR